MTYWFHAYCADCKEPSPPLFVSFNYKVSLYPIGDGYLSRAGDWLEAHSAAGHDVRLVHENDGNCLSEPKFPGADMGDEG